MKLKNRLFLVFFPFAFLPVAVISFIGLELATDGVDRLTSPGIERALANAGSLVELTYAELEMSILAQMQNLPKSAIPEDYLNAGLDFAVVFEGIDTMVAGPDDSAGIRSGLISLVNADSARSSGHHALDDRLVIFGAIRDESRKVVSGYLLDKNHRELLDELGSDLQRFDQLKLLKSSGKRFMQLVWLGSNFIYLLLILFVTRVTARSLTKPLSELGTMVEKVGPGSWDIKIGRIRNDEIGTLAAGFRRMSTRLSETTSKLVEAERNAAWQQTARVIAHGIKNILAPIKLAMTRLSNSADQSDSNLHSPIGTIRAELDLLEKTAKDFSTYGRPVDLKRGEVNLNMTIRQAVRLCRPEGESSAINLLLDENLPLIVGDEDMLREAIINLIRNAYEAIDRNGSVTVETTLTDNRVRMAVTDTGKGIDPKLGQTVFEPYVTSKPTGTGLGLAIARKIVESCGGTISYDTGSHGTTFRVTFKVAHES
ncbi:MAG: HAMP domain-containing sensor histidine kinase [Candidatus Zixiibacteriota bacterium]